MKNHNFFFSFSLVLGARSGCLRHQEIWSEQKRTSEIHCYSKPGTVLYITLKRILYCIHSFVCFRCSEMPLCTHFFIDLIPLMISHRLRPVYYILLFFMYEYTVCTRYQNTHRIHILNTQGGRLKENFSIELKII